MTNSDRMGKMEEEFSNFMFKVNEVNSIVQKLSSNDKEVQKIGDLEAQKYLGEGEERILENIDEEKVQLKIKSNRTVVNKKALEIDNKDAATMSQEAFMAEISKDADKRYQDKLVRTEKMETFKKQATLAFRRGEYEKALTLYNKAIEQIKDSCLLYNNRALTYINLKLYDKAKDDLTNWALRLNEDCLKSWLLLAKANFLSENIQEYQKAVREALSRNPDNEDFIKGIYCSISLSWPVAEMFTSYFAVQPKKTKFSSFWPVFARAEAHSDPLVREAVNYDPDDTDSDDINFVTPEYTAKLEEDFA